MDCTGHYPAVAFQKHQPSDDIYGLLLTKFICLHSEKEFEPEFIFYGL